MDPVTPRAAKPQQPAQPGTQRETLLSLTQAYLLDRDLADEQHPPIIETDRCRYCHGAWQHWHLAQFEGHVRCAVSVAFQRRMVLFFDQNPAVTYWSVATAFGTSPACVKAWWANIKQPRKHPNPSKASATLRPRE